MKKYYLEPIVDVNVLPVGDVILASGILNDSDGEILIDGSDLF